MDNDLELIYCKHCGASAYHSLWIGDGWVCTNCVDVALEKALGDKILVHSCWCLDKDEEGEEE